MSGAAARLRLVMTSEHVNLERAVDQAESFFSQHLSDEELVYNLMLMASEAVTNGMEHGNAFDPEKEVIIEYVVFADYVMITVEDEGPGFERFREETERWESHTDAVGRILADATGSGG